MAYPSPCSGINTGKKIQKHDNWKQAHDFLGLKAFSELNDDGAEFKVWVESQGFPGK